MGMLLPVCNANLSGFVRISLGLLGWNASERG